MQGEGSGWEDGLGLVGWWVIGWVGESSGGWVWVAVWLIGWLGGWLAGWLAGWPAWCAGGLAGRLGGWLAGWLWLARRLAGL